ncbi:hypothetical protein N9W89_00320 [Hellea sp.]|nr:hypothetical protein [Hellea sp.]
MEESEVQSIIESFEALPQPTTYRRISFDDAQVNAGFIADTYFLTVSGVKSTVNMDVFLQPLIYIEKPDYWEIEVIGHLRGIGLPATAPYTKTIDISANIGHKGIKVIGSNKEQQFDIP